MQLIENMEKLSLFVKKYNEEDLYLENTLKKIIGYEKSKIKVELKKLMSDLKELEQKYKKKSETFYHDFKTGKLDDKMDFIEWASLYEMYLKNNEKIKLLWSKPNYTSTLY